MISLEEAYEMYDKNGLASYYHNGLIWTLKEENRG